TAYWDTPYEAGIEKENKTSTSVVTPASRAKTDMYFDEEEGETNEKAIEEELAYFDNPAPQSVKKKRIERLFRNQGEKQTKVS
ncbi:10041_t:CDS:2, partial [Funneliformis mosseae]